MIFLNGSLIPYLNERGERILDDSFLIIFNFHNEDVTFTFPDEKWGKKWKKIIDTTTANGFVEDDKIYMTKNEVIVSSYSIILFSRIENDK